METKLIKVYVTTLDQNALQTALDSIAGSGVFNTGREDLADGTRPVYYQYDAGTDAAIIAQAQTLAAQQDQTYFNSVQSDLLSALSRAGAKSRTRQPACVYSASDQTQAQGWLANPSLPCPLVVQVRALSKSCTTTLAAEQIISIYNNYLAYPSSVDDIMAQGQSNILSATNTMAVKEAYNASTVLLGQLENTNYGDN